MLDCLKRKRKSRGDKSSGQAPARTLFVVNHSTRLDGATARRYAAACDTQLRRDVCPAWHLAPVAVTSATADLPRGSWIVALVDDVAGIDGALGFHAENKVDLPVGFVLVETIYANSPDPVDGPLSVPAVLSHELVELAVNPQVNTWFDSGKGFLYWGEACDPVQRLHYAVDAVSVSDFVVPAWFDFGNGVGPFDHLNRLDVPGEIAPGGYMGTLKAGRVEYLYGNPAPPRWFMDMKARPSARPERLTIGKPV